MSEKSCKECGTTKPLSEFGKHPNMKDGHINTCKPCKLAYDTRYRAENRERVLEGGRRRYRTPKYTERRAAYMKSPARAAVLARYRATEAGKTAPRRHALKKHYGLTLADYQRMFDEQGGRCAICGDPPSDKHRLQVDHCHATGKVRSLLCFTCNAGLGSFRDDKDKLLAAAAYLMVHSE